MDTVAILQARMGSTRLPGKIVTEICGQPMLLRILERVEKSVLLDRVVVATSESDRDDLVEQLVCDHGYQIWRGSEDNVLERFYECAKRYKADIIVRLTGDNALIDAGIIDEGISYFKNHAYDYVFYREGLPVGMAIEIFSYDALNIAYENATDSQCLEHVTPYLYRNPQLFRVRRVPCAGQDQSQLRWTMDTEEDKKLILDIYEHLYQDGEYFSYLDILKAYEKHPEWININREVEQVQVTYRSVGS